MCPGFRGVRPDWRFPSGVQVVDGADACRRTVREQISYGVDWIKVYANAGAGSTLTEDGYIDSPPTGPPKSLPPS
jgi:imidazolonepropionase-like amidohydrolase